MKTIQELIKDLTNIIVEQWKIDKYLQTEKLDLSDTNLHRANLNGIKITKQQLEQLTIKENE